MTSGSAPVLAVVTDMALTVTGVIDPTGTISVGDCFTNHVVDDDHDRMWRHITANRARGGTLGPIALKLLIGNEPTSAAVTTNHMSTTTVWSVELLKQPRAGLRALLDAAGVESLEVWPTGTCAAYTNISRDRADVTHINRLTTADVDRQRISEALERVRQGNVGDTETVVHRSARNAARWTSTTFVSVGSANDGGFLAITREQPEPLDDADTVVDPQVVLDTDGRIIDSARTSVFGWDQSVLVGRLFTDLLHDSTVDDFKRFLRQVTGERVYGPVELRTSGGDTSEIAATARMSSNGTVRLALRDERERHRVWQRWDKERRWHNRSLQRAELAVWVVDERGDCVWANHFARNELGAEPGLPALIAGRPALIAARSVELCNLDGTSVDGPTQFAPGKAWANEVLGVNWGNGTFRWYRCNADLEEHHTMFWAIPVGEAVERLVDADRTRQTLEAVTATTNDGVIVVDAHGRLTDVNPTAARLLDLEVTTDIGFTLGELGYSGRDSDGNLLDVADGPVGKVLSDGLERRDMLVEVGGPDGRHVAGTWFVASYRRIPVGAGHGVLIVFDLLQRNVERVADGDTIPGAGALELAAALHDDVLPTLAATRVAAGDDPDVVLLVDQISGRLRQLAYSQLNEPVSDLYDGIGDEADRLRDAGVHVTVDVAAGDVSDWVRPLLGRVAVEALRNARRHADATNVTVTVHRADDQAVVEVGDDGCGIDVAAMLARGLRGGFGILSMRAAVETAGGTFSIRGRDGGGTLVSATVPNPTTEPAGGTAAPTSTASNNN